MIETKIIKAVFGGGRYAITAKRTRTDYGQVLEFVGIDLPDTFECIFSNSDTSSGVGKKQIGSNQRVLIPDEYLATGQTIYAWVLVHDGEGDGRHMYKAKIPVDDMPDTSPEEPTPAEESVISQAITALNTAVNTTTQKAQEASESADRAEQAAEGVEGYAERAEAAQSASEDARDRAIQAETSASASAATATTASQSAISSATAASQSAITAEGASESAQEYASASSVSASQASGYATTAESKATEASGYASSASTSAQTASQKALEASHSASTAVQAKTDAESAKTASQTAQGLAESARDNAITAKTSAEDARDEAQILVDGISGKVEQIDSNTTRIESLEDDRYKPYATDTASGAVASFVDGVDDIPLKSCIVQIEPVQDLHGYDHPWPAGGGKNLFDEKYPNIVSALRYKSIFVGDGTYTLSTSTPLNTENATNLFLLAGNVSSGASTADNGVYVEHPKTVESVDGYVTIAYRNANGVNPASYETQLELGSTATSYAPYENNCPISGWTGVNIRKANENLWDDEWYLLGNEMSLITDASSEFYGYYNGAVRKWEDAQTANGNGILFPDGVDSLTITADLGNRSSSSTFTFHFWFYYSDGTSGYKSNIFISALSKITATRKSEAGKKCIGFCITTSAGVSNYNGCIKNIMVTIDGTTEFVEPVQNPLIPITFPTEAGTVYGGYVDVTGGELVVDRAMDTFDGTENWNIYSNDKARIPMYSSLSHQKMMTSTAVTQMVSNSIPLRTTSEAPSRDDNIMTCRGTSYLSSYIYIFVPPTMFTTTDALKAYLAQNPLQIVYPLATPVHYPLTPQEIKTLLGTNNIWADTGDTEVEYRADTTLYISRLTEPDADMIADSNITSGQYFMVGNSLYRATSNIASGASVIVGTNAVKVSLATALNEINA